MAIKSKALTIVFLICNSIIVFSQDNNDNIYQWLGPNRDGIYNETGLIDKWPEEGPQLLWSIEGIGNGYSSPLVTPNNIFVTGEIDSTGFLFCYKLSGKLIWKSESGKEWMNKFEGPRSTPVAAGSLVYTCSGNGKISCFDITDGSIKWTVDMIKDLHGRNAFYGYSESLLIDANKLYCCPAGKDTNIVALNRFTGEIIWTSKALEEKAAYTSAIMIEHNKQKILVSFSEYNLLGLNAETGKLLWSHTIDNELDLPCNIPLYENGFIYFVVGPQNGAVKLALSENGQSIKEVWRNKELNTYYSGTIKIGDYIYGYSEKNRAWAAVNKETGKETISLKFGRGRSVFADNKMYCYNERGELGLIKLNEEKLKLISSFSIQKGTREHFCYPVISNGILYIRHGNSLMAYNIKQN